MTKTKDFTLPASSKSSNSYFTQANK